MIFAWMGHILAIWRQSKIMGLIWLWLIAVRLNWSSHQCLLILGLIPRRKFILSATIPIYHRRFVPICARSEDNQITQICTPLAEKSALSRMLWAITGSITAIRSNPIAECLFTGLERFCTRPTPRTKPCDLNTLRETHQKTLELILP